MQEIQPLKINSYLSYTEIEKLLDGIEYIMMAAPSMLSEPMLPIHFTIILNTSEPLPEAVVPMIFDKFCQENNITQTSHLLSNLERVAFAMTAQETPMPKHLIDDAEAKSVPWKLLYIFDFLGDAEGFKEVKDGLSGWSYSYN